MGIADIFTGYRKTLTLISMIVILVGLIGSLVISLVWWTRINPWFSHGLNTSYTVYQLTLACWILAIIGIIFVVVLIILSLIATSDSQGRVILQFILSLFAALVSIGTLICGIYASSFALKSGNEEHNTKCAKYLAEGVIGARNWAISEGIEKLKDFLEWNRNIKKHLFEQGNDSLAYTDYLCEAVGVTSLVFGIVLICGVLLYIITVILGCIAK